MRIYELAGERVTSLERFYDVLGEAVNGPGGYFGRNLDALRDYLRGGWGTPEAGAYAVRWLRADRARAALGYPETVRQLERRRARCHPEARAGVQANLNRARRGEGPTVFDWLIDLFRDEGVPLELR